MKRIGALAIGLILGAVTAQYLARERLTLTDLKNAADADAATAEGQAYLKAFFTNPWMLALDSADEQCRAAQVAAEPLTEFVIALRIGDSGYPTDVLVSPEDAAMRCLADRLKATSFIKPPHDGFAIYMPYRATEPGTERRSSATATGTSDR